MITKRIYLKELFPKLGNNGANAYVECIIPEEVYTDKDFPCMILCPGGGYDSLSNREGEIVGTHFLAEGYRIFVLQYSIWPHHFPQALREVAAVLEVIYAHAKEWHIDTKKVSIAGFSAGGHLAAQYSNRFDCTEIREVFPESKPVQATILGYAVLTARPEFTHERTIKNFLGGYLPTDCSEKGASCELLVNEKTPPTFLWHTAADAGVPSENSLLYAQALGKYKIPYELHIYPYGPHGLATADEMVYRQTLEPSVARTHKWIEDAKSWLKIMGF